MSARTVFGRDPALITTAVEGVVAFAGVTFLNLNGDQIGSLNAATSALLIVYVAWGVYDKWTAAVLQAVKVLAVLAVTFGAHITADQTGLAVIAISGLLGAFARTQLTSKVPSPAPPPVVAASTWH